MLIKASQMAIQLVWLQIAKAYEEGGAACLSVLTDRKYFQGSFEYLQDIRNAGVTCPLLCKEFIVEVTACLSAKHRHCGRAGRVNAHAVYPVP